LEDYEERDWGVTEGEPSYIEWRTDKGWQRSRLKMLILDVDTTDVIKYLLKQNHVRVGEEHPVGATIVGTSTMVVLGPESLRIEKGGKKVDGVYVEGELKDLLNELDTIMHMADEKIAQMKKIISMR